MSDEMHADAVEGGNYDVIRARLTGQGEKLRQAAEKLDEARKGTFGSTELDVLGEERVRTENNCVPVDIVQVGGSLLFGYNVFLGLKRETRISDVFSLQTFEKDGSSFAIHASQDEALAFLEDERFQREFDQLYQYYKDARLIQLRVTETKLLAVFQIGATATDVKVLRWAVDPDGSCTYIDDRGERDHVFPPSHDFEWTLATRDDHVRGRHPHVNILDTVFVETVGGDLTVKVEDNTEDGEGIFSEPVSDANQSLDDAEIAYARLGALILMKIRPYREEAFRYLVFNVNTREVVRIDTIGQSCVQLPEDHGILFPGGFYLRTGEYKLFDTRLEDLEFVRAIRAPNGEDILYVFHRRSDGLYVLYPYNLIQKAVAKPIHAHGYSLFDDGTLVVFRGGDDPVRVHPMQVWKTPFMSAETYEAVPNDGSLLSRIGNRDLVRGISDSYTLVRLISNQSPTRAVYEEMAVACNRFVDAYIWAADEGVGNLRELVEDVRRTAELIVDEFEKVQVLQRRAKQVLRELSTAHDQLLTDVRTEYFQEVREFLGAMTRLRQHRGQIITNKEVRYVDTERLDELEAQTVARFDMVSNATVTFLLGDDAFAPLASQLDTLLERIETIDRASELVPITEDLDTTTGGVNLLAEVVAGLEVEDPTRKTVILDGISEVFAHANRVRAVLERRRKSLRGAESRAEFGAQFKLFGQAVASALALCDTPEACDEQLSRLLLQLEELEGRFGDFDEFLGDLADKREEVYDALSSKRQTLLDERQRRVEALVAAAERILGGVQRRARSFEDPTELNAWFAGDPMVLKLRQISEKLMGLDASVKADEVVSKLKTARQDALRSLRDKTELFDGGEGLIRFGKHRFTVNTQPFELALVPRGEGLAFHLTGTDYYEDVDDPEFAATKPFWSQTIVSENREVYRGEYLASSVLTAAESGSAGLDIGQLEAALLEDGALLQRVRDYAADKYDEGYDRGIHDADAAAILERLLTLRATSGLLRFPSEARVLAGLFWGKCDDERKDGWIAEARVLARLRAGLGHAQAIPRFIEVLQEAMQAWHAEAGFDDDGSWFAAHGGLAAAYLFEELTRDPLRFSVSAAARTLREKLVRWQEDHGGELAIRDALRPLAGRQDRLFAIWTAWYRTFAERHEDPSIAALVGSAREAAMLQVVEEDLDFDISSAGIEVTVEGLLGQHPRIDDGRMVIRMDTFTKRLEQFREVTAPGFRNYRERRQDLVERRRSALRVDEYKPRVMSSFVRNKLINDVYLPIVGDNLAKQLGAAGAGKRTDLMGLLLLVSPPGYGKTTLMEYIASRLGLVFVKVNGPALGHAVHSIDPAEAPNATARQEVEKINLALEMGNNVMLYLDDIQHTHPELLQKFISLCDAQRRIEGVWKGKTRTYDLRGKKFCVVMAGNPYTESGDKFQIPDMLANRADTYNLGDVLDGREEAFALSFIENALTSNAALAQLATREQSDVYKLVRRARGEEVPTTDLSYAYSAVELNEIEAVLRHMTRCQKVLLRVNEAYVSAAAMEDDYRTEPRFQLQGSYRNMNKLAEKVVPAMTDGEVEALITDHYQGESQTLTTGAEANLLKLAELRGTLTDAQDARWREIKDEFRRLKLMGGDDDPAGMVTGAITGVMKAVEAVRDGIQNGQAVPERLGALDARLAEISASLASGAGSEQHLAGVSKALGGIQAVLADGAGSEKHLAGVSVALGGIEKALAERTDTQLDHRLEALETSLGDIGQALRAGTGLEAASLEPLRRGLSEIAARVADVEVLSGIDTVIDELRALRGALEGVSLTSVTATPAAGASRAAAGVPPVSPPSSEARSARPQDLAAMRIRSQREALLQHAYDAIDGKSPARAGGETELTAAVSVVETLAMEMVTAARSRLSTGQYDAFVDEVKRAVAVSVGDLAKR